MSLTAATLPKRFVTPRILMTFSWFSVTLAPLKKVVSIFLIRSAANQAH
jgi:hypothetical protein